MSELRLRPGDRLGSQSVQGWICTDALGERYETIFGSTTHALDACVPPAGADAPTLADYRAFAERVSHVRHPAVVRYFAAGESSPRPGAAPVPWLRGEHQEGASASILETPLADAADLPRDDDGPVVPTFGALLRAAGGRLSPADRDALLGDVLEGLSHLHSLGLPCGHLAPDEISLGHIRHRSVPIARLRVYAWPREAEPADLSADLALAAPLFRAALDASSETTKPREAEAFAVFADALAQGVFGDADQAAGAFGALCEKWGRPRRPVAPEEDAPDDGSAPEPVPAPSDQGHGRRHHRKPSASGSSEVARRLMSLVRIFAVIAFIVGVGVGVYFYLSNSAEAERRRLAAMSGPPVPAILVIPTERSAADLLAELPDSVFEYTPEQLELAAAAEGDPRAPAAVARAALESLDGAESVGAEAFDAAAARIAPVLPALRKAAADDPAAGLLLGRAQLLGLGTRRDVPEGYQRILKATLDGLNEAYLVFGDLLASDVKVPDLRAESRIERDRRAVAAWRRAAGPDTAPAPQLWRAADRIAPMLRAGRGIPAMNNDYPKWLGRTAAAGHVPSLVALSEPGGFASDDPAEALKWLRVLSRLPGASPELRAWAQFRMAGMFERGEGTPPSAEAGRKALERAAAAGNREAMLALAERLYRRKAKPGERAEAADWRKRAESAPAEVPMPELWTVLVAPPPGRGGEDDSADADASRPTAPETETASPQPATGGANRAAGPAVVRRPAPKTGPSAGADPELVPLTDGDESPLPRPKKPAFRNPRKVIVPKHTAK